MYDQKTQTELNKVVSNGYKRLTEVLTAEGININPFLARENLDRSTAFSPAHKHHFSQYCRVVEDILKESNVDGLGLKTGVKTELTDYGVLGYALLSSSSLRETSDHGIKYRLLTTNLIDMSMHIHNGIAINSFWETQPLFWPQHYLIEESLAASWKVTQTLLPELQSENPIRVRLAYAKPTYAHLYEEIFQCPISFNESTNEICYPESWLDMKLNTADEVAAAVCAQQCDLINDQLANQGSTVERVRRILLSSPMQTVLRLENMAEKIHLSPRTLRQRLYDAGTNYKEIVNGVRIRLAIEYLESTNFSIQEIAYLVGYDHGPNFFRAFKKVLGITPSEYRDNLIHKANAYTEP